MKDTIKASISGIIEVIMLESQLGQTNKKLLKRALGYWVIQIHNVRLKYFFTYRNKTVTIVSIKTIANTNIENSTLHFTMYGRFHVKGPRKKVNVEKCIFLMKCER